MPTFFVQTIVKNSIEPKINRVYLIQSNGKKKLKSLMKELDLHFVPQWLHGPHLFISVYNPFLGLARNKKFY